MPTLPAPVSPDDPEPESVPTDPALITITTGMCQGIAYTRFAPRGGHDASPCQPLLLVHGAAHTRRIFDVLALDLAARGLTVITLDLRGHGESPMPDNVSVRTARAADYVADVRTVVTGLAELRDGAFVLLGHSMGGIIAQLYARRFSVAGVIVLASVAPQRTLHAMLDLTCRFPCRMLRAFRQGMDEAFNSPAGVRTFLLEPSAPESRVQPVLAQITAESTAILPDLLHLARLGLRPLQTEHILFLGGSRDVCFRPPYVRQSARDYGTEAVFIPHAPHNLMAAHAVVLDQAARKIERFVQGCVLPAST